jgi:GT2 family glycosyltransferase/ubiquinone/menaquinone biosynthesis C-methylase UbiE
MRTLSMHSCEAVISLSPTHQNALAVAKAEPVSSPVRVAIVLLNWNSRDMTTECINSLRSMKGAAFRIIVVDNGSRDGSVDFLRRSFPDVEIIANDSNLGFAAGCNLGVRRVLISGEEFVLLINNDTIVDSAMLTELVKSADVGPRTCILSPKIYYFDPPNAIWWVGGKYNPWTGLATHIDRKKQDTGLHDQPCDLDWATGCAMLVRCSVLREVGLFDEEFFGNGEDVDLCIRMRRAGYVVRYVPSARLWHHEGIDYKKNVGEYVRTFTQIRNLLWIAHKHGRLHHWLTIWPTFAFYTLPRTFCLSLVRGDFRSCSSTFEGVTAFWRMLRHHQTGVLPRKLVRPSQDSSQYSKYLKKSRQHWEEMGTLDPYWAILTRPGTKFGGWNMDHFFSTGAAEIAQLMQRSCQIGLPRERGRALDFGCGVGRLTSALAREFRECVGLDISPSMISQAERLVKVQNCSFIVNNKESLPFPDRYFDLIYTSIVLQHVPQRRLIRTYVAELVRVLRPGGLLVMQIPTTIRLINRLQARRRVYDWLRALGMSDKTLYERLYLHPILMNFLSEADTRDTVDAGGGRVLDAVADDKSGPHIPSLMYYVTK